MPARAGGFIHAVETVGAQDGALLGNLTHMVVATVHTLYAERVARDGHPCAKTG